MADTTVAPGAPAPTPEAASDIERLFQLSTDLLACIEEGGAIRSVNPAWERVLGWPCEWLVSRNVGELIHPEDLPRALALGKDGTPTRIIDFEVRYRCLDGNYRWLEWNARCVGHLWYAVARDVTDRRRLQEQATLDSLTGLPNRAMFNDRLTHALARLRRHPGWPACCSSTSTTSSSSTTGAAMTSATASCARRPCACGGRCEPRTRSPASAATSS
jgi:PAS domain S-box-containing protein